MKLGPPALDYRQRFLAAAEEFDLEGAEALGFERDHAGRDFEKFVRDCASWDRGLDLPEGWIPQSTFWLVDEDGYVGSIHIRHELTPALLEFGGNIGYAVRPSRRRRGHATEMLRLALVEARAIGLERALITCDTTNTASRKVIEANGGVLQDEIVLSYRDVPTRRYWIEL